MHFDIPDLRLFIHVAEANSLTSGAKRASLSTAAASMRIKSLEDSDKQQLARTALFFTDRLDG